MSSSFQYALDIMCDIEVIVFATQTNCDRNHNVWFAIFRLYQLAIKIMCGIVLIVFAIQTKCVTNVWLISLQVINRP